METRPALPEKESPGLKTVCPTSTQLSAQGPSQKGAGALPQPEPLPCGAPFCRAGGRHARRSLARLFSQRTREIRVVRRLIRRFGEGFDHNGEGSASERGALGLSKSCPPWMSTPPRLKGGHPYDGICVTPGGGNRRSFLHRPSPPRRSRAVRSHSFPPSYGTAQQYLLSAIPAPNQTPILHLGLNAPAMVSYWTTMFSRSSRLVISSMLENH